MFLIEKHNEMDLYVVHVKFRVITPESGDIPAMWMLPELRVKINRNFKPSPEYIYSSHEARPEQNSELKRRNGRDSFNLGFVSCENRWDLGRFDTQSWYETMMQRENIIHLIFLRGYNRSPQSRGKFFAKVYCRCFCSYALAVTPH